MRKGILREFHFRTSHLHDFVVLGSLAWLYQVTRKVRKQDELVLEFLLSCCHLGEYGTAAGFELGNLSLCCLCFSRQALLHQGSDIS